MCKVKEEDKEKKSNCCYLDSIPLGSGIPCSGSLGTGSLSSGSLGSVALGSGICYLGSLDTCSLGSLSSVGLAVPLSHVAPMA
eukprot:3725251-Ditylum_brightwellii.AAC.1